MNGTPRIESDDFKLEALDLLPETGTKGLKHTFCCGHIIITAAHTTA